MKAAPTRVQNQQTKLPVEHALAPKPGKARHLHRAVSWQSIDQPYLAESARKARRQTPSLHERGITVKKVKVGLGGWITKGVARLLTPFLRSGVKSAFAAREKSIENEIKQCEQWERRYLNGVDELARKQEDVEQQLEEQGAMLAEGGREALETYAELLGQRRWNIVDQGDKQTEASFYHRQAGKLRSHLNRVRHSALRKQPQIFNNIDSILKLTTDLRELYPAISQSPTTKTAYEITLPDLLVGDKALGEYTCSNVRLVFDTLRLNDNGDFEIGLVSAEAHVAQAGGRHALDVQGGCKLTIKAPLGKLFERMLTCRAHQIKGAGDHFFAGVERLIEAKTAKGEKAKVSDLVEVSLPDMQIGENGDLHPLLSGGAVNALLNVFSPLVDEFKRNAERRMADNSEMQSEDKKDRIDFLERRLASSQWLSRMLERHIAPLPADSEARKQLQESLDQALNMIEGLQQTLQKEKQLLATQNHLVRIRRQRIDARTQTRDSTFRNTASVVFALRNLFQPECKPFSLLLEDQELTLNETTNVHFRDVSCDFQKAELSPDGSFVLNMDALNCNPEIMNTLAGNQRFDGLRLADVEVCIRPPLGRVVHDLVTLDLPLEAARVEALMEAYRRCTAQHKNEDGGADPKAFSDYLQVNIGQASCTMNDTDWLAADVARKDRDKMAEKLGAALGETMAASYISDLLTKMLGVDASSSHRLLNMISMPLLGRDGSEEDDDKDEFFDALETTVEEVQALTTQNVPEDKPVGEVVHEPVPQVVVTAPDEPSPLAQEAIAVKPVTQDAPPVDHDALGLEELPHLKNIHRVTVDESEPEQQNVQFEIEVGTDLLLGKMTWLMRMLAGRSKVTCQVTGSCINGKVDLSTAKLQLTSAKGKGLARKLSHRLARKALKKRELALTLDQAGGEPELKLSMVAPAA